MYDTAIVDNTLYVAATIYAWPCVTYISHHPYMYVVTVCIGQCAVSIPSRCCTDVSNLRTYVHVLVLISKGQSMVYNGRVYIHTYRPSFARIIGVWYWLRVVGIHVHLTSSIDRRPIRHSCMHSAQAPQGRVYNIPKVAHTYHQQRIYIVNCLEGRYRRDSRTPSH